MRNKPVAASTQSQTLSVLVRLASRLSADKPVKPYWNSLRVNGKAVSFYTVAGAYGIKPEAIKPFLTRNGYFAKHLPELAKTKTEQAPISAADIRAALS